MGMYTELCLNVELKKETPERVISLLEYMVRDAYGVPEPDMLPAHPLFTGDTRWRLMLSCGSYTFPPTISRSFVYYDDISQCHYLSVLSSFKNYDNEIELFLDWLMSYVSVSMGDEFLGYHRYEESEHPTLIYAPKVEW